MNTAAGTTSRTRTYFRNQEAQALHRIPGMDKLLAARGSDLPKVEAEYPDAAFALQIISNPFISDRELGAIRMEAYASILHGENLADVRFRYEKQTDAYIQRHAWD